MELLVATDPAWVDRALSNLEEVLIDHAHLEKKAASAALNLLFRYPEHEFMLMPLSRLAREELRHFEQMLSVLAARGIKFRKQRPSRYASALSTIIRAEEPERLLDSLLCAAFIEARSSERMRLLAGGLGDETLRSLYEELVRAEDRHHRLYFDLAAQIFDQDVLSCRVRAFGEHEAKVISEAEPEPRLHG